MANKHMKWEHGGSPSRQINGRPKKNLNLHPIVDTKHKEGVVRRLVELFQHSFDLDVIQSVAQTCQWDFGKSTEALFVLGGSSNPVSRRSHRINSLVEPTVRYKTKSLPSTLKGHKAQSGRLSDSSTKSMPNGLRAHPAHFSNDSLPTGQVWQRHYKSKPQSPGLLTMIPPSAKPSKESLKFQKAGSSRSSSRASLIRETPEVKVTSAVILRIQQLAQNNVKVMVLMRGVPGAGKTHLAQVVVGMVTTNDFSQHIFSTDDYFIMLGRGVYSYDPNQIEQAHNWNQKRVSEALRRATNPVVVDNTHTQAWEMRPYVTMAVQNGYLIEVLEPVTPWKNKEAELAKRNTHNVPREKIRQMLDRYEPGWNGDKLLKLFQLKYQHCGAAHVSPEVTGFTNSPLTQHRQHGSMDQPEKPKRKRNSPMKKDRRHVAGVEINVNQEQQLDELNKLFAEYGKTMDAESRQKVLDAGVPISEVVTRIRKLQGTLLPMPAISTTISEEESTVTPLMAKPPVAEKPDFLGLNRHSPTDSVEPDTMSSSGGSDTSECDSDSEAEPLRRYLDDCVGHFVDGEDQWEDEEEAKSDGAVGGRPPGKTSTLITSSQEELSIIDYQMSTPAGSSQDELSLLEFDRRGSPNGSSSSSEEPKTELSTVQDSLQDLLLRSASQSFQTIDAQKNHIMKDVLQQTGGFAHDGDVLPTKIMPVAEKAQVELNDSLLEIFMKRFTLNDVACSADQSSNTGKEVLDTENNVVEAKSTKSPDLEQIPLPCIPELEEKSTKPKKESTSKLETIVEVASAMQSPPELVVKLAVDGKDRSPEGILRNFELNWASIPITGSWDSLTPKPDPIPPHRIVVENEDKSTQTTYADFDLWNSDKTDILKLETRPRIITSVDTPVPIRSKSEIAMFDKSSSTFDEFPEVVSIDDGLRDLMAMFPDVPAAELADLLEKCQGDREWAVELLLDPSFTFHQLENTTAIETVPNVDPKIENIIADGKKTIKRRKDRKGACSEISLMLKKEIEGSFQIGAEHYTDNVLFLKKLRNGEINADDPPVGVSVDDEPSTSSKLVTEKDSFPPLSDLEELDEPMMPMSLDTSFFESLVARFGSFSMAHGEVTKDYRPIINIPESLARQLYWLWVETVNQQVAEMQVDYEDMLREDQLLASALQEQEYYDRPPNFQEIMDRDLAESFLPKDKREDTLASILNRQLLCEGNLNSQVIRSDGLTPKSSHSVISERLGQPRLEKGSHEESTQSIEQTLVDTAKLESLKDVRHKPIIIVKEPAPRSSKPQSDIIVVDPSEFRREIQILQQRRTHYLRLGQEAIRKKSHTSAGCFFQLAFELKEKMREANQSSISLSLFSGGPHVGTTIDLHYLFTAEAVRVVDLFLDHHIANLQTGRLDLHMITGRGQRSPAGRSRIKPIIQKRLEERQLCYVEDNPGMIRVTIHPNDLLSSAL